MISDVIEIGAGNLYGGTGKCSEITLRSLTYVIDSCSSLNVPMPKVDTFKKTHFIEKHGWERKDQKNIFLQINLYYSQQCVYKIVAGR